jgi:beta-phosphoglucomutase-like phosphatase (HAD superfamily)
MTGLAERPSPIEAVLFDLDGVIVDSEPWWHAIRVEWAAARGLTWTEADNRACMGRNSRDWAAIMQERLALDLTIPEIERAVVDALVARYASEPAPRVPGAVEAVVRIAGLLPSAIASSAHPAVIAAALAAVGLTGCFPVIVSADNVAVGKPAPDVYLEAARRLGFAPDRCLVVEDSLNGVLAGRAAGMTVVLIPNASVPPGEGAAEAADLVMARLADLDPRRLPG